MVVSSPGLFNESSMLTSRHSGSPWFCALCLAGQRSPARWSPPAVNYLPGLKGSSGLKLFLSLAVAGHAWISAAALLVCMMGGFQGCDGQHCSLERLSGGAQGCNGLPGSSSASVPGRSCPALSSSPSFPGHLIRAVLEGEILAVAVSCLPRLANAAVVVGAWPWGSWEQVPWSECSNPEDGEGLGMRPRDLGKPFCRMTLVWKECCQAIQLGALHILGFFPSLVTLEPPGVLRSRGTLRKKDSQQDKQGRVLLCICLKNSAWKLFPTGLFFHKTQLK
ncbi:uncharacterized protein LOC120766095 isoform X2 [Hirundo rustica]|uniref:uncharacterized protein LOC120766095 isoform X2 n=1 Tax=Hirundo rustica TaxID=43150 RepID=UPI0026713839|nr:uncharacterized protein LOC120766095 isoform X2 [Hirundo rustica]